MAATAGQRRAAGYVRVSSKAQKDGYSPELQEEAIRALCAKEGYELVVLERDVQKGRVTTREGYQRILDAVRGRAVDTVLVYMFDRWGRDAGEWITRANELERRGVDLYSVTQGGAAEPLVRAIHAAMAEDYSRQLAKRIRPARERAAREGTHCGGTPYGYVRRYPEQPAGSGGRPRAVLQPSPKTADTVRRLFERYAYGSPMTLRQLALWAHEQPDIARPERAAAWSQETLGYLLRNPVYVGEIAYNRHPKGYYERAAEDASFVVDGHHEGLVTREVWDAAQVRLGGAPGPKVRRSHDGSVPLAAGLLACHKCGGRMTRSHGPAAPGRKPGYICQDHVRGLRECTGQHILAHVVHAALLAQVKRLRWHPWKRTAVERSAPASVEAKNFATLAQKRNSLRSLYDQHLRLLEELDASDLASMDGHRMVGTVLWDELQKAEQKLAEAGRSGEVNLDAVEALHARLRSLARDVERAEAAGDDGALRALVAPLVRSVRIIERVPEVRASWARADVEWTDEVVLLLRPGALSLAEDVPSPDYAAERAARQRERVSAYRERQRQVAGPRDLEQVSAGLSRKPQAGR